MGARGGFGSQGVLGGARVPPWVINPSNPPDLAMDWTNNRAWQKVGGVVSPISPLVTFTRASAKTDLLPSSVSGYAYSTFSSGVIEQTSSGFLSEETRTNSLLNSTVPATQTTGSLTTGTYTLWVNGSGSATPSAGTATLSGAAAATNGFPNTFIVTVAGTVTVTVSGSLNAFQLEKGEYGTSFIVTAGTTVARAADVMTMPNTFGSAFSIYAEAMPLATTGTVTAQALLEGFKDASNRTSIRRASATGSTLASLVGGTGGSITDATVWAQGVTGKLAGAFAAGSQGLCFNGGSVDAGSIASLPSAPTSLTIGSGSNGASIWFNGWIRYVGLWTSQRLLNAQLQTITT